MEPEKPPDKPAWEKKEWRSKLRGDNRDLSVIAKEWIRKFENPATDTDDALSALHIVFTKSRLVESPQVIRYVLDIALWNGQCETARQGGQIEKLQRKAFEVVANSLLGNWINGEKELPAWSKNDSSLLTDMAHFMVADYCGFQPYETDKTKKFKANMTGLTDWYLNLDFLEDDEEVLPEEQPVFQAMERAVPDLVKAVLRHNLPVKLFSHHHDPTKITEMRDRLVFKALEARVLNDGARSYADFGGAMVPGQDVLVRYVVSRKWVITKRLSELAISLHLDRAVMAAYAMGAVTLSAIVESIPPEAGNYAKAQKVKELVQVLEDEYVSYPKF
jgi:hypothetical protein